MGQKIRARTGCFVDQLVTSRTIVADARGLNERLRTTGRLFSRFRKRLTRKHTTIANSLLSLVSPSALRQTFTRKVDYHVAFFNDAGPAFNALGIPLDVPDVSRACRLFVRIARKYRYLMAVLCQIPAELAADHARTARHQYVHLGPSSVYW